VRGGMILGAYGAVLVAWLVALALEPPGGAGTRVLLPLGIATAAATAAYTGWLFGQAHGRVLWMQRGLWARFLLHAGVAGGATTLLAAPWLALSAGSLSAARWLTVGSLVADGLFGALVGLSGPRHRAEEFRRAVALLHGGPFAATRRLAHLGAWLVALPALVVFPVAAPARAWPFWALGAAVALVCMAVDQHLLVRAGQAPPIS